MCAILIYYIVIYNSILLYTIITFIILYYTRNFIRWKKYWNIKIVLWLVRQIYLISTFGCTSACKSLDRQTFEVVVMTTYYDISIL